MYYQKATKMFYPSLHRPFVANCNCAIKQFLITKLPTAYSHRHKISLKVQTTSYAISKIMIYYSHSPEKIFLIIDVTSWYTNIPNAHGIADVEKFLENLPKGCTFSRL